MSGLPSSPAALAALQEQAAQLCRTVLAPLPTRTLSEWADECRVLSTETSASPGRWRTDALPYLRGMLDAMSDPAIETVVLMTGSQVGKTEGLLNLVGYTIAQNPGPCLMVLPTLRLGRSWSTDRFACMCRDTPVLRGTVQEGRAKDARSTMLSHKFAGGSLTIAGSNSAASLSSRPIRTLLLDEVDRFSPTTDEGDPVALATRRTAAFPGRKIVMASSPTIKGFSRIEEAYEEGDQRRFFVPCPHCQHELTLEWSGVRYEEGDPESAAYVCPGCGVMLQEREKLGMLRRGRWVATYPERRVASFHISALYSPVVRWAEVVRDYLASKDNPERMKVWTNCQLGETYEEQGEQLTSHYLMQRVEPYGPNEVPDGVGMLTAGVDTQGAWLDLSVWGWGEQEESWLIHHETIPGDPGTPEPWRMLDELLGARFRHRTSGALMPISVTFIDSGGHHTGDVYRFTRERLSRRIFACHGANTASAPILGKPSRAGSGKVALYAVGVSTLKESFFSRLRITKAGPGYVHLPEWATGEYLDQLTGEKRVTRYSKGRPVQEWRQTRGRVEALDARNYAHAALHYYGVKMIAKLGKWAERWSKAEAPAEPEPQQEQAAQPVNILPLLRRQTRQRNGGSWVNRW